MPSQPPNDQQCSTTHKNQFVDERESLKNDKKKKKKEHIKIVPCLTLLTSNIISYKILNHKSFSFPIFKTFLAKLKSIVIKILQASHFCLSNIIQFFAKRYLT